MHNRELGSLELGMKAHPLWAHGAEERRKLNVSILTEHVYQGVTKRRSLGTIPLLTTSLSYTHV